MLTFPSGNYEFLHNVRDIVGGYKACSLFSPMTEFASQMQVTEVTRAVMAALFDCENRAETDRSAEIRAARLAEVEPPLPPVEPVPSRWAVITGGLAAEG